MVRSPLTVIRFRYSFFGCWFVWTFLHMLLIMNYGFPLKTALADSLVSNGLLLFAFWITLTILRFYLPYRERYWYVLLLCSLLSVMATKLCKQILTNRFNDSIDTGYSMFLSNSFWIRLAFSFLLIGCMAIISVLWYSQEEEQENRQRKNDAEQLSKEAELYTLRQQLQPHFLFNSLNSISSLVVSEPERARKMIQQLSDFLRGTLKKEEEKWVKLDEEWHSLELYLDIEKVRFGHRLSTIYEKEAGSEALLLPPMILQPIVENAIKFGLYDTTDAVAIYISAAKKDGLLILSVKNPFDPETSQPRQGNGFGLNSVKRRLFLLFARNDLVETIPDGHTFTTILKIPQSA